MQIVRQSVRTVMKNVPNVLTMRFAEAVISALIVSEGKEISVLIVGLALIVQNISVTAEQAVQSVQQFVRNVMKSVQNVPMMKSVEAAMSVWIVSEGKGISA